MIDNSPSVTHTYTLAKKLLYYYNTTHQIISVYDVYYTTTTSTYDLMIATTETKNRSGLERLHPYKHRFVHTYALYIYYGTSTTPI